MTGHSATMSMDGTLISQADIARIEEEDRLHIEQKLKAARVVAAASLDIDDCRILLDLLGLDENVVAAARTSSGTTAGAARGIRAA